MPARSTATAIRRLRVLCVDDEAITLRLMIRLLERIGFDPMEAFEAALDGPGAAVDALPERRAS